jgi:hypothetical protein
MIEITNKNIITELVCGGNLCCCHNALKPPAENFEINMDIFKICMENMQPYKSNLQPKKCIVYSGVLAFLSVDLPDDMSCATYCCITRPFSEITSFAEIPKRPNDMNIAMNYCP